MKKIHSLLLLAFAGLAGGPALADCAADATVAEVRAAYARGEQQEKAGNAAAALDAYVSAQQYTCEANPVAATAARRAAAIAQPLGDAARARGDHAAAFSYYERGGHFAAADRELLARIEASPVDIELFALAQQHVGYRALPAFQANEAGRLAVTGAYVLDDALPAAVAAMPARAVERALADERAAFDEAWLRQYVALMRQRPENPTDFSGLQQFGARMQALQAGRQSDPLREPLTRLEVVRAWESTVLDPAVATSLAKQRMARADARAQALSREYADAPALLGMAIDYLGQAVDDAAALEPRLLQIHRQAEGLGDAAVKQQRLQLAIDYYDVAGADAKADKARSAQQTLAQATMSPTIESMQQEAMAMAAQFADPRAIAEMQRQALEAQKALQSQAGAGRSAASGADDLAAELGL